MGKPSMKLRPPDLLNAQNPLFRTNLTFKYRKQEAEHREQLPEPSLFQEQKKIVAYCTKAMLKYVAGFLRTKFQTDKTLSIHAHRWFQ
jgi:hypothetical protein